jgi:electron transport complex protein RnfB
MPDETHDLRPEEVRAMTRRRLLKAGLQGACLLGLGGAAAALAARSRPRHTVWQLDPAKCIQCGKCATNCVLAPSAVKCVHAFAICGYCELCTGYFDPEPNDLNTGAENQLCPTGAIQRTFVEDPYYQYTIDETLCIGCGKCVKGCGAFGNGSLFLQVRHDLCLNCNECSIAIACPSGAYRRVPADQPYLLKDRQPPGKEHAE